MSGQLKLEHIAKGFRQGDREVSVLRDVDLVVEAGESVSIMGPSGSGKSTLLHIIGTLDQPDGGTLEIEGRQPFTLDEPALARFRNEVIGFVFQDHHLLPQYSVLENVLLPSVAFPKAQKLDDKARELLDRVGLSHRLGHRPAELSGGERQRVAIARALINGPSLLLCDEPTGNLDNETANAVTELLLELHHEEQNILVVVTHSDALAARCSRRLVLGRGALAADGG